MLVVSTASKEKIEELSQVDLDDDDLELLPPDVLEQLGLVDEETECQPGSYHPVPGDCTSYVSCGRDGKKKEQKCSTGLHWVQSRNACDWKELSDCNAAVPRKSYGECQEGEYSPIPENCGKYRRCVHKKYQEFSCQSGTHWNNQLRVCDHPANAGCVGGTSQRC